MERFRTKADAMMDEQHETRRRIREKTKGMAGEALARWYHEQAALTADENGYDLVPSPTRPGAYRLERRPRQGT